MVVVRCASRTLDVPKKTAQSPVVDGLGSNTTMQGAAKGDELCQLHDLANQWTDEHLLSLQVFPNNRVYVCFFFLLSLQHGLHLHTRLGVGHAWC